MSSINFKLNWAVTPVSNIFIEEYMTMPDYPVYSLVYIYALKKAINGEEISNGSIAEKFCIMESEVAKIWRYWENAGLIKCVENGGILSIEYLTPNSKLIRPELQQTNQPVLRRENKPVYNPEDIKKISEKDEQISLLLKSAETLLNKPLSSNDINTIVGFYDWLGLPLEVIYVLINYCGEKRKGMRYMETTAMDWSSKGINTVEAAEEYLNIFLNEYKKIMRAYGISDRSPSEEEQSYMSSWVKKLNMPMEVIKEACARTVNNTGKVSFAYTNTILNNWHNAGIQTLAQVKEQDAARRKSNAAAAPKPQKNSKINDYEQRSYDESTLEAIFNRKADE